MAEAAASARIHRPCAGARLCRGCSAAYLGVSIDVFDDEVKAALPGVKIGARVGYLRGDLDAWLDAHREAPSAVQQSRPCDSAEGSGISGSRSPDAGTAARRVSEIEAELKPISPRGGSKRIKRRARSLRLV